MKKRNHKKTNSKTGFFSIRIAEEDKKVLFQNAKQAGMTATDFMLFKTINKVPKRKVSTPLRIVLIKMNANIGKMVSNVNQIAVVLSGPESKNATEQSAQPYTKPVLTELQNLSKQIFSLLDAKDLFTDDNKNVGDHCKKSLNLQLLSELSERLHMTGTSINKIAETLNTEKFRSFTVRIKDEYIQSVLSEARGLSIDILKMLTSDNTGKDEGERSATVPIPSEEG